MADTAWFERGDGARFEAPEGSEAYAMLVAQGAVRITGPDAAPVTAAPGADSPAPAPTKAQLLERAAELGLELPPRSTNAAISEAIAAREAENAAKEAELAAAAAAEAAEGAGE